MSLFNFGNKVVRNDEGTYEGEEAKDITDTVSAQLEKGCLLLRSPFGKLSPQAKVTVQEGQQMVFMSEGMYSAIFSPGEHVLNTDNIPYLERLIDRYHGGETAFKATMYCVSTESQRLAGDDAQWNVCLSVSDDGPSEQATIRQADISGTYEFRICNPISFIRSYSGKKDKLKFNDFAKEFKSAVAQLISLGLSKYIAQQKLGLPALNDALTAVADNARADINEYLEDYGLELTQFAISSVQPKATSNTYPDKAREFIQRLRQMADQHGKPETELLWKQLIKEAESIPPRQLPSKKMRLNARAQQLIND